ncbi:hypothetical protein GUJ93_ZPchr0006g44854 [Zizania palustris]|uniref:DUF7788 domain-containing protein n=1 Tax=Zizania palustris TaxID=103762 RepID=A0A8J5VGX0_ZIZPA|nr:hypothetical protein GUJ93_ZPchr0006g44854 [Zizania palustris]
MAIGHERTSRGRSVSPGREKRATCGHGGIAGRGAEPCGYKSHHPPLSTGEFVRERARRAALRVSLGSNKLHRIAGETLYEKVQFIRVMDWGMNTNFQAVFDKILEVAVGAGLTPERMVRRVLVFSDMEFDQASAQPWETDYEAIVRKFMAAGYGATVPEAVFWNLRDSKAVPVTSDQKGVALVSGFSKNLLKLFLDNSGIVSPRAVMEKAIAGQLYDKLAMFD